MKITTAHLGSHVSWTIPPRSTATVRVTSVTSDGISTLSTDGYGEYHPVSWAVSLEDIAARWRPATDEEAAGFELTYRPAPQNWE